MLKFLLLAVSLTFMPKANAESKPVRFFMTVQKYILENSGQKNNDIYDAKLILTFPNGKKYALPEGKGNQTFQIGNGQSQEINKTFEIPAAWVVKDGFQFSIQMERNGTVLLPCNFDVVQISQFNRGYLCHTDTAWQLQQRVSPEELDKEGVAIRVFTTLNIEEKEIPKDAQLLN